MSHACPYCDSDGVETEVFEDCEYGFCPTCGRSFEILEDEELGNGGEPIETQELSPLMEEIIGGDR